MKKAKPPKPSREEKIKLGFSKKYKLLIPAGIIVLFLLLSFITKLQHKENIQKDQVKIPYTIQREAYNSYKLGVEDIVNEGERRYPEKDTKRGQLLKYNIFYREYMDKANFNIEQYYNIDTNTLAKIIMRGDNENWSIIRTKK